VLDMLDDIRVQARRGERHGGDDAPEEHTRGYDTFEDALRAMSEAEGCTRLDAMEKAARAHPDLLDAYQQEGEELAKAAAAKTAKARARPEAEGDFLMLVDEIARRDGMPRYRAMEIARRQSPEKFRAFQSA